MKSQANFKKIATLAMLPLAGTILSAGSSVAANLIIGPAEGSINISTKAGSFLQVEIVKDDGAGNWAAAGSVAACTGVNIGTCYGRFTFTPEFPPDKNHEVDTIFGAGFNAAFVGTDVGVKNFILPFPIAVPLTDPFEDVSSPPVGVAGVISEWLTFDDDNFFDLKQVSQATFTQLPGPVMSGAFAVNGIWRNEDGSTYKGLGLISASFSEFGTQDALLAAATQTGGIKSSTAGNFRFEIIPVPEPTTITGLAFIAGSALLLKGKKLRGE